MKEITYQPIGLIHSDIKSFDNAPIQAVYSPNRKGWIELYSAYKEGLMDIEGFSHIILIYHFHLCRGVALKYKPFLDDMDCTPDSRQLVKQRYLKQTPLRTVLEIYSQELNAASSCCTPSQ